MPREAPRATMVSPSARKLLDWARGARSSGIAGAYLIPPFKRYEEILDLF